VILLQEMRKSAKPRGAPEIFGEMELLSDALRVGKLSSASLAF